VRSGSHALVVALVPVARLTLRSGAPKTFTPINVRREISENVDTAEREKGDPMCPD
jgi:hypothetical protein